MFSLIIIMTIREKSCLSAFQSLHLECWGICQRNCLHRFLIEVFSRRVFSYVVEVLMILSEEREAIFNFVTFFSFRLLMLQ
jgi:hypothetical protein